jgi:hypothetical protein
MNSCEVGTGAIFTGSQLGRHRFGRKFLPHLFPGRLHVDGVVSADLQKIADEFALHFDHRNSQFNRREPADQEFHLALRFLVPRLSDE